LSLPSSDAPLSVREAESIARDAVDAGRLEAAPAARLGRRLLADPLLLAVVGEAAHEAKQRWRGDVVTVARNVFIPLTNLCRDRCTYCTFAKRPGDAGAKSYTLAEVAAVSRDAARAHCTEALFCLGDKPELAFASYREWLEAQGYPSTAKYLVEACRTAVAEGMLPHSNAGLLTQEQMAELRPWNASMGLMLETVSDRLCEKGGAHHAAPDKKPELRLRMHREAGELKIPFTTGMLMGIGETSDERVATLLAIRELSDRFGHIQEAILQPFHPKTATKMSERPTPEEDDVVGWVAIARLMLGPDVSVQAPPNLANLSGDRLLDRLLRGGADDFGGVSPMTIDFINPEAPWPKLDTLRRRTEAAGQTLRERLPVYPEFLTGKPDYFDASMRARCTALADAAGYARTRQSAQSEEAA
jgi:FO synthase